MTTQRLVVAHTRHVSRPNSSEPLPPLLDVNPSSFLSKLSLANNAQLQKNNLWNKKRKMTTHLCTRTPFFLFFPTSFIIW